MGCPVANPRRRQRSGSPGSACTADRQRIAWCGQAGPEDPPSSNGQVQADGEPLDGDGAGDGDGDGRSGV